MNIRLSSTIPSVINELYHRVGIVPRTSIFMLLQQHYCNIVFLYCYSFVTQETDWENAHMGEFILLNTCWNIVKGSIWTLNLTWSCWSSRHKCEFDWCREHSHPNEGRGVKTSSLWFDKDSVSTQGCCRLLTTQSRSPRSPSSLKQF